jgi:predicted membrane-bound dolichyl-phosphate-mannose-protein mannosyltransferase
MKKLLLMSLILMTFVLPIRAARLKSLKRGATEMFVGFSIFGVVYLLLTLMVYPELKN